MKKGSYKGIVEKIVEDGHHGAYVVTRVEELGSVTFSLDRKIWKEKERPEPGMFVLLKEIRKKSSGWRANFGRFLTPSDEQPATKQRARSNEQ